MAWLLNIIEEGARPATLTRRIELEEQRELQLRLYVDLRAEEGRAPGLRRTLLLSAEEKPSAELGLVPLGLLRCRIELGDFQVLLQPHRPVTSEGEGARRGAGQRPGRGTAALFLSDPLEPDAIDFSMEGLEGSPGDGRGATVPGAVTGGGKSGTGAAGATGTGATGTAAGAAAGGGAAGGGWGPSPFTGFGESGRESEALQLAYMGALMPDGSLRPLSREERPDSGTRYRIRPELQRGETGMLPPITLELSWSDEESQELGRVRHGGPSFTAQGLDNPDMSWVIPAVEDSVDFELETFWAYVQKRTAKAGISATVLFAVIGLVGGVTGAVSYSLYVKKVADEAEENALLAEQEKERLASAASNATSREQECVAQSAESFRSSGDEGSAEREEARLRLSPTLAETALRKQLGEPAGQLRSADARRERLSRLLQTVVERKASRRLEPMLLNMHRQRLLFQANVRPDLPPHMLLFHTHPRSADVSDFYREGNGVDFRGTWGLSSRVVREFGRKVEGRSGVEVPATVGGGLGSTGGGPGTVGVMGLPERSPLMVSTAGSGEDPRLRDDWSANAHLEGLRRVRKAMLGAETGGRLPAYPEQLHLWSMALWYAYNHMPDLKAGRAPQVEVCVDTLVLNLALFRLEAPDRTLPVLPDISGVVAAEAWTGGPLASSALCPWREERLFEGARYALDSLVELWAVEEQEGRGGR